MELETRMTAMEDDPMALVGEIVHALRQEFQSGDALLKQRLQLLEQKVGELTALITGRALCKDERPVSCGSRECRRTERQRHHVIAGSGPAPRLLRNVKHDY